MMLKILLLLVLDMTVGGCFKLGTQAPGKTSGSASRLSTVLTTQTKTTVAVDAASAVPLTMGVAANSTISGTSVVIVPGSLTISTTIIIEQGADLVDTSMQSDVALANDIQVTQAGNGVIIRPSESVVLSKPLQLSLPLPTTGLNLGGTQYAIYYRQYAPASSQLVSGFKIVDNVSVKLVYDSVAQRDKIEFDGYFGIYWVVALNREVLKSEVPPVVASSESIVNKSNAPVITTIGIVKEEEVKIAQAAAELVWLTPSLTFIESTRTVELSVSLAADFKVSSCKAEFFESSTDQNGQSIVTATPGKTSFKIMKTTAHNLFGRLRCLDAQARVSISPRSEIIAIRSSSEAVTKVPIATIPVTTAPVPVPAPPPVPPTLGALTPILTASSVLINATSSGAVAFVWTQLSGPGSVTFSAPTSEDTNVTASADGIYNLRLTATSADSSTSSSDVQLVWDTTAPSFGGLSQVMRRAPSTEAWLFWRAANDQATSAQDIIYEICWNATAGTCNTTFTVMATSAPGAWDHRVTGLSSSQSYQFVVRARDEAGNTNTGGAAKSNSKAITIYSVTAGTNHTCAIMVDRTIQCWGDNAYGQVGTAGVVIQTRPVQVAGLSNVDQLALGRSFTCARISGGTIKCWGAGSSGALGDGLGVDRAAPTLVSGITTAISVSAGLRHTCAVLGDNTVKCWGQGYLGQIGNGSASAVNSPQLVTGITDAAQVYSGHDFNCVRTISGSISCWGENSYGQLSDGTQTNRSTPVGTSGLTTVAELSLGRDSACARLTDNSVKCWGAGQVGQLGDGGGSQSSSPVSVTGITTATSIAVGMAHACARLNDGTAKCWGHGSWGQIGNGYRSNYSTPQSVIGLSNAASVSSKESTTCALLTSLGEVRCWGANENGQLGVGMSSGVANPISVFGLSSAKKIGIGWNFGCAALISGGAECWGEGGSGTLGNGNYASSSTPVPVTGLSSVQSVVSGVSFACALESAGTVKCWGGMLADGSGGSSSTPVPASGISTAIAIGAGPFHACAVLADHTVKCWGRNSVGQLGDGTTTNSASPVIVSGVSTATKISMGQDHTCAVLSSGGVACWGGNHLGNGSSNSLTPVAVSGITTAIDVAGSFGQACAAVSGGSVYCWNGTNTPTLVSGLTNVSSLAVGIGHVCALITGGTVKCWGNNQMGQLGITAPYHSVTPLTLANLSGVTSLEAYRDSTCATLMNGKSLCWGDGDFGTFGLAVSGSPAPAASVLAP